MSQYFKQSIFYVPKNVEDNVSNKDMHESSEVCETFREHLLGVKNNKNAIDALKKFALKSLNYKPAFVVTKGNKKHEEMVCAIAIGILYYCRWTFFGTTIPNGSESNFHTILQTMDSTCEEQLLIAYKTALDVKAHALRLNDDFVDRVLATTKVLLGMQLIDDSTNKLECNDLATLLANSFQNVMLKNSSFLDLANALTLAVTDIKETIRSRKKGVANCAKMFSIINSISDENRSLTKT